MEAKTIMIRKANVVLNVSESQVQFYLQRGYEICDSNGRIISKEPEMSVAELQNQEMKQEISKLRSALATMKNSKSSEAEEVETLKAENERLSEAVNDLREQIRSLRKQLKDAQKQLQQYE